MLWYQDNPPTSLPNPNQVCACPGFCGEREEDHAATVDLMERTAFLQAFMYAYSDRGSTHAARHLTDDVPADVKLARLQEVIAAFRSGLPQQSQREVGRRHLVRIFPPFLGIFPPFLPMPDVLLAPCLRLLFPTFSGLPYSGVSFTDFSGLARLPVTIFVASYYFAQ